MVNLKKKLFGGIIVRNEGRDIKGRIIRSQKPVTLLATSKTDAIRKLRKIQKSLPQKKVTKNFTPQVIRIKRGNSNKFKILINKNFIKQAIKEGTLITKISKGRRK